MIMANGIGTFTVSCEQYRRCLTHQQDRRLDMIRRRGLECYIEYLQGRYSLDAAQGKSKERAISIFHKYSCVGIPSASMANLKVLLSSHQHGLRVMQ